MKRYRFKALMRERTSKSDTGTETLLSVSEYYGVKPRSEAFEDKEYESRALTLEGYREVKRGDLVMNYMLAWKGAYGVSDYDGIVSPAYAVFHIYDRDVDPGYLHYHLRSEHMRAFFRSRSKGIIESRLRLYPDTFLSLDVNLPDRRTQSHIRSFLDSETARIDQLIEKKRKMAKFLAEKLLVQIGIAVTQGLDAGATLIDSKVPYLGYVPKRWQVVKVGSRYSIQLGKMLDSARIHGNELKPYLRVADVQWGTIKIADLPMMDFSAKDRQKFVLKRGDLLVNEGGSYVGRSAIWEAPLTECYYQKALHRLRPIDPNRDTAKFFYYVMNFATKQGVFVAGGNQTTIDHLTAEALRRYKFAFPPIAEQHAIAAALSAEENRIATIVETIERSIDRLAEFRTSLITSAVTGQFDIESWQRGVTSRPGGIEVSMPA
jgi:type I restriction enzyme S subunit